MSVNLKNCKVVWPDNYKRIFTLADLEECKVMLSSILDSLDSHKLDLAWECCHALSLVSDGCVSDHNIFDVSVEYAGNQRIYEYHGDGSGNKDLWITVKGFVNSKFYIIGFYLSDIWSVSYENRDEVKSHMYIRKFVET